jgi:uncharacterized membrane protein YccF (DUF307 family)
MAFMVLGCFYLMVFGVELAYQEVFGDVREVEEVELIGHPVRFNHSKMIPVVSLETKCPINNKHQHIKYSC